MNSNDGPVNVRIVDIRMPFGSMVAALGALGIRP
jgi:hypothetical protein